LTSALGYGNLLKHGFRTVMHGARIGWRLPSGKLQAEVPAGKSMPTNIPTMWTMATVNGRC
jgi:hypothetical protein